MVNGDGPGPGGPADYPGKTISAKNRKKFVSDNIEKLRDISDENLTP